MGCDGYSKEEEKHFRNEVKKLQEIIDSKTLYLVGTLNSRYKFNGKKKDIKIYTYSEHPGEDPRKEIEQARLDHLEGNHTYPHEPLSLTTDILHSTLKKYKKGGKSHLELHYHRNKKMWTFLFERSNKFCKENYRLEEVASVGLVHDAIHLSWTNYNNIIEPPKTVGLIEAFAYFNARALFGPLNEEEKELYDSEKAPDWMKKAIEWSGNLDGYFEKIGLLAVYSPEDALLQALLEEMAVTGLSEDEKFVEGVNRGIYRLEEEGRLKDKDVARAKEELQVVGLEGKLNF